MRVPGAVLAAAVLTLTPAPASADVGDYIGRPVASVRLELEGRETTDQKLLAVVETRAGRPLSMAEVRESVTHLFSLGRFEDVQVHAALAGGSVTLRYDLEPIHHVARIEFAGDLDVPGLDTGQLRHAIVERFGASPPVGRAADVARLLVDELHQRGYLHAAVSPRADIEHAPERATLVFTVNPGARTRVGKVDIVGTPSVPRQTFLSALGIVPGAPFERDALSRRIDQYVAGRRAKGFYEASVVPATQLADDDRVVNLTLTVAHGPRVHVIFDGDSIPSDKHDELAPVQREGSVDEDLLEDSSNRIEEYLRAQGYRDASALHTRVQTPDELRITFTVKKGAQYRVSRVEISGNASVPLSELAPGLRQRDGQPFSAAKLDADVSAIESLYHRRGFAAAKAEAALEQQDAVAGAGQMLVLVRMTIREGVRTLVASVRIEGNQSVADAALRPSLGLQPGQPFFLPQIAVDRDALQLQYANLGYQSATVEANPGMTADLAGADVVFTVHEGPRIFVDHVLIVGNVRTRTETIERELQIKPGDPLGLQALGDSQRRLAALGLFRRTRITEVRHGDETTRDLLVTVEEAPVTTVGYGGGVEAGQVIAAAGQGGLAQTQIDFAPRAFFETTRRNLFGKNRSVNLFGRISLHPDTIGTGSAASGLSEYRLLASFREPRVLNTRADASLTGVIEQQRRSSFNFARKSFIAEAGRRLAHGVSLSGSYQIQRTKVFFDPQFDPNNKLPLDRLFPQVLLSSFASSIARDTRDDVLDPGAGGYLSANGQIAARRIGSEVGLAKTFLTAQAFRTLPHSRRMVLAGNVRVGLATGFPRDVVRTDGLGQVVVGNDGQPIVDRVEDLPASERFFAGGDTMRGFALDQLGTASTIKNGVAIGGNALIIVNAELRAPVRGGFGIVGFFDTGNVFARTTDINLGELRSAAGFGLRYKSPIGPIRVDLGFKLRRHTIDGRREDLTAFHISLGQAF
jgi:outer membrane protein insertion porin family